MATPPLNAVARHLTNLLDAKRADDLPDAELVRRYRHARDEAAFAALVRRHQRLVLGVCRHVLREEADAEDAFQATFLVLARAAGTIRKRQSLASWLHGVAFRTAMNFRKSILRRRKREHAAQGRSDPESPVSRAALNELQAILHEEVERLPECYRTAFVLCCLEGRRRAETAQMLGWNEGTLSSRLAKARTLLQKRLTARGVTLSAALCALAVSREVVSAGAVAPLVARTVRGALAFSAGDTGGVVSAEAAALAEGVVQTIALTRGKTIMALLLLGVLGVVGAGVLVADQLSTGEPHRELPPTAERTPDETRGARKDGGGPMEDALPAGSTLRFGTSRFRFGIPVSTLAISPDGKTALAANANHVERLARAFDLTTGRVLFSLPYNAFAEAGAYSPDGKTLVTKDNYDLHVRDAATGKVLRTIEGPRPRNGPSNTWTWEWVKFTPDGKAIVVTSQGKFIHLIDFASGKPVRDYSVTNPEESAVAQGFPSVNDAAFAPDGKRMASGGYDNDKGNYFARLWDMDTGKEIRRFQVGKQGYGVRCLAFSPDGKTLATLGTQSGVILRLFDVDTGKEIRAFPKDGDQRPGPGSVAFSPDGKTVAAAVASIRLYDTTTGALRLRIDRRASELHFTDGGKTLTAAVSGAIYRWDTATGKVLTPEGGDSVVEQVLVTPDGSRVVTRGQDGDADVWDGTSGKHLRRFQAGWARGLAMSPDGRFLAWPVDDSGVTFADPQEPVSRFYGSRIRLYDLAKNRFVGRFPAFKGSAHDLAFTGDGKELVTVDQHPGTVCVWNFKTGTEVRRFNVGAGGLKKKGVLVGQTQLSPDGKTAVVTYGEHDGGLERLGMHERPQSVRFWDVATGKPFPEVRSSAPLDGAFSPDGRLVFTNGSRRDVVHLLPSGNPVRGPAGHNAVYEVATGVRVAALPDELTVEAAAFSRDGRFLATATADGLIQVWEVATWTRRTEFRGHRDRPTALAFTPTGQLLSGSQDTTVLLWDTRPPRVSASVSLEKAWNDLAAWKADVAFRSEGRFLAAPADTVRLFAERVRPTEALDPKRVQRWLADLNSDQFAVREAASRALRALDRPVIPYLEEALKKTEAPEVRIRVQKILDHQRRAGFPPEQLRELRAVAVLEALGDRGSRGLLKRWAGGPVGAVLTVEASRALARLETRR
jgi:RNA polymerase sigma factor (sigma-70 family)